MHALSAVELLTAWEQGWDKPPTQRALGILAAACPENTVEELAHLSIGQRDARLLVLREWTFGSQLISVTTCHNCDECLELVFRVADIRVPVPLEEPNQNGGDPLSLDVAGYKMQFRPLNSLDLLAINDANDPIKARYALLERCLLTVQHNDDAVSVDLLPADVRDAVIQQIELADPQGDVQLALSCPFCNYQWQAPFDIVAFFWAEISAWATRILREVHVLASAYGWHEADILNMSARRRQAYLELVASK